MKKEWYLGLDIGTNSIGWAATDPNYKVLRKSKRKLIGVELFDAADTAEERRLARNSRRVLGKRKWRLSLLKSLFEDEIKKVDSDFFLRLEESKYHLDDKRVNSKYVLFNDKNYTDIEYNKQYPTIFHLRAALMTEENPDIRKVYLALHNIMKSRGHFLFDGLSVDTGSFDSTLGTLLTKLGVEGIDIAKVKAICTSKGNTTAKVKDFKELTNNVRVQEIFRLIFGGSVALEKIYGVEEYKELDSNVKTISFKNKVYDEVRSDYEVVLGTDIDLLDSIKRVYDSLILMGIKQEGMSLSQSKMVVYDKHKSDKALLKEVIRLDSKLSDKDKKELIIKVFSKDEKGLDNYVAYTRNSDINKSCSGESFRKFVDKVLDELQETETIKSIKEELALGLFLPLQKVKDNSVIPNQLHREELIAILENASKYNSFFTDEVKAKVIEIFDFKVPYFVGPLNATSKYAWAVRNKGYENVKVTPWNYKEVINESKSAAKFIDNLVGKCTYLEGELVLPDNSLLYSEYKVLNELNALKVDGDRVDIETRNLIIEELYLNSVGVVTKAKIKKLLVSKGLIDKGAELTGVSNVLGSKLKSRVDFTNILGANFDEADVEKMIYWLTVYGDAKYLIRDRIIDAFGNKYTEQEITAILKLNYKDWGRLSEKFLKGIYSKCFVDTTTGEMLNIIDVMRSQTVILMEILGSAYDLTEAVEALNSKVAGNVVEITPALVENLYVSPSVKRAIWQTIKLVERLKKLIGCEPKKIFIETTRTNQAPKVETDSRYKTLVKKYSALKSKDFEKFDIDVESLYEMLKNEDPSALKSKRLYHYYSQLGKCLYTGKTIERSQVDSIALYDLDHIYPQSKVKDDSLDNMVLVCRVANGYKSDTYPLSEDIQKEHKELWSVLKANKMISDTKYERLVRVDGFTTDELTGFIARQLVETSQSVKTISKLLGKLNKTSRVVYSKAENVDQFKHNFGKIKDGNRKSTSKEKILKVRELNDLHHAYDAYLNIVVGNVYDVRFTANPRNFVSNKENRNYSLNTLFYYDVKGAWVMGETVKIVESVINNPYVQVNKMAVRKTGKLYDATIYKANKAKPESYHPLKTKDGRMLDVTKYGGYSSVSISHYVFVGYTLVKPKESISSTYLVPIRICDVAKLKTKVDVLEYAKKVIPCKAKESIEDLHIIRDNITTYTKVKLGNIPVYLGGKTGNYITYRSALQIRFDVESTEYMKTLTNYNGWRIVNRSCEVWKSITFGKNLKFYDKLLEKMQTRVIHELNPKKFDALTDNKYRELFAALDLIDQTKVLLELVNLMTQRLVPNADVLRLIDFKASVGTISLANSGIEV